MAENWEERAKMKELFPLLDEKKINDFCAITLLFCATNE